MTVLLHWILRSLCGLEAWDAQEFKVDAVAMGQD
jgi:hypothetical protein